MVVNLRITRITFAIALIAVMSLLIGSITAEARIVPQKGIAGVRLGMTQKKVRQKLGRPDGVKTGFSPIGAFKFVTLRYGRTKVSFDGTKPASRTINVSTRDRRQRTARGVGVGSTKAQVRKKVARVRCAVEFGVNHCYVGQFLGGRTVTDFRLVKKKGRPAKVVSVGVGIVLD